MRGRLDFSSRSILEGFSACYCRFSRLLEDLALARSDGRYSNILKQMARLNVRVLNDLGLTILTATQQQDLLEVLDDRHQQRSTIVTCQFLLDLWYKTMEDSTLANAILDRLIHNAHRIALSGDSMRKHLAKMADETNQSDHSQP